MANEEGVDGKGTAIALYGLIPGRNTFHNESERHVSPRNRRTIHSSVHGCAMSGTEIPERSPFRSSYLGQEKRQGLPRSILQRKLARFLERLRIDLIVVRRHFAVALFGSLSFSGQGFKTFRNETFHRCRPVSFDIHNLSRIDRLDKVEYCLRIGFFIKLVKVRCNLGC